jgi:predicted O-methyltransferase YrrM
MWSGKVIQPVSPSDHETKGIIAFNDAVTKDPRVENVMVPIRDGVMIIRKLV